MNTKTALKSLLATFIGGAAGAALDFINPSSTTPIDWHQVGYHAIVGGVIALCGYLAPSPVKPK